VKSNGSVSLSFLDLLTCCLGAMLLLFFVIVLIRQQSSDSAHGSGKPGGTDDNSFLLVTVECDGGNLEPSAGSPLKLTQRGREIARHELVVLSVSERYAVLYATGNLPDGTELWLRPSADGSPVEVNVYDSGQPSGPLKFARRAEPRLFVW